MWRLSLREMLVLVAIVALAIVSLKYASETWLTIVLAVTMFAFFVASIEAVVDRGTRQAFAIGFVLTMAGYWIIVMTAPRSDGGSIKEFDHMQGHLPSTRLMRYLHAAVDHGGYYDFATGNEIPNYDPQKDPKWLAGGGGFGGVPSIGYREMPPRGMFMPIGHCWWGLLLGYFGGLFATCVYFRRAKEQRPLAA